MCPKMSINVYADNRHISKIQNFRRKLRHQIKISVPFVRCTSCSETTMYITFLKSISFAVNNIEAVQRSRMSQLHFEIVAKRAKKGTILPKKKPPFKGNLHLQPFQKTPRVRRISIFFLTLKWHPMKITLFDKKTSFFSVFSRVEYKKCFFL